MNNYSGGYVTGIQNIEKIFTLNGDYWMRKEDVDKYYSQFITGKESPILRLSTDKLCTGIIINIKIDNKNPICPISGFSKISGEWYLTDSINSQKAPYYGKQIISGNK